MRASIHRVLSIMASALLALVLVSAVTTVAPQPAEAASTLQVTVTRAASGKLTMRKGASYKLAAKASAGKLSYKSSKKSVVTVSKKGVLKARKAGRATITIKAKSGTRTATKRVKVTVVTKKKFKAVKKVTAEAPSSRLDVGGTAKIKVAFKPKKPSNKNVTFKSSAPAVLSVDAHGKVTAKRAGKATVTVTSCDNSKAKAKVAFTVTQPAPAEQPPAEQPPSSDQPPAEQPPSDQPPGEPSLGELYTFTSSFVEGSEDAMCVFEVQAENVPAVSLVAGDGTYAMNDSGVDGDAEGDDGIWSATADLTWLPAGESVECKATAGGLETGPLTVTAFPAWSEELQAQAEEQEQAVADAIDAAVTPHINADTGYIESEDGYETAYSALEQALRGLVEDGAAVSCEMTEAGGSVKLASGPRCLYTLPLEGVQASGEDVRVEFWCVNNMGVNPASEISVDKTLNDQEVTCRAILTQMPQNSVVWWWGHGSYTSDSGSFLLLSEKYAHAVEDMGFDWNATVTDRLCMYIRLDSGETGIEGTSHNHATACAALGAGFFDKYRPDMSGDVFIASTCCGAKDEKLAYAMRKCGCRGYFGFSDLVKPAYNKPFVTSVIHGLQSGKTLGEAVAGAKVNVGKDQRTFMSNNFIYSIIETNNCEPRIVYGENFVWNRKAIASSTGANHFAALTSDGSLWTWGRNDNGQLGNGTFEDCNTPSEIMGDVVSFSAGSGYSAAVKKNGSLWTWGWNYDGRLGDGTTEDRSSPVKIMSGAASVTLESSCGAAIKTDGSLWLWGNSSFMEEGTNVFYATPTKIMDNVASVSLAGSNIAVIKTDGSLWTWGNNAHGQLGDGTNTNRFEPVKIMDGVASVSLSCFGVTHCAAIKKDGTLWTWGSGEDGMLGDGSTANRSTPVKIMDGVASISLAPDHAAAIKTDGTLWAWGANNYGQLGNGMTTDSAVPVRVMDNVSSVSFGYASSSATKTDGSLWTWGAFGLLTTPTQKYLE